MDAVSKTLALRSAPLFEFLAADALLPVAALCSEVELEFEEQLFDAGDAGDSLYIIVRGSVRVEGDHREIARLGPGDCVGEMAALDWEPRSAAVIADEPSLLIRLDRNDLMDLLLDHTDLVDGLARVLVRRLRRS